MGVLIYGVALSIGGTLQGASWLAGEAFIESVRLMAPYWVWRAVGGSLMFLSHLIFAYNLWKMLPLKEGGESGRSGSAPVSNAGPETKNSADEPIEAAVEVAHV